MRTETKAAKLKSIKISPYVSGSIVSLLSALSLIFIFALVIRYCGINNSLITPVNIAIKIISISLGVFVATKDGTKGLLKGAIIGIVFVVLCTLVFAIISHSFSLRSTIFADFALAAIAGIISGILFVNLRKN